MVINMNATKHAIGFLMLWFGWWVSAWVAVDISQTSRGFSIVAEEIEMRHVLIKVADFNQRNVWVSPDLTQPITLRLSDLSWDEWIAYLTVSPDIDVDRHAGVYYFMPATRSVREADHGKHHYYPRVLSSQELLTKGQVQGMHLVLAEDEQSVICEKQSQVEQLKRLDVSKNLAILHTFLIRMDEDKMVKTGLNLNEWSGQFLYTWPIKQWLKQILSLGVGQIISQSEMLIKSGETSRLEYGDEVPYIAYYDHDKPTYHFRRAAFILSVEAKNIGDDDAYLAIDLHQDKFKPSSETNHLGLYTQSVVTTFDVPFNQNMLLASFSEQEQHDRDACPPWMDGISWFCQSDKRVRLNQLWLIAYVSKVNT